VQVGTGTSTLSRPSDCKKDTQKKRLTVLYWFRCQLGRLLEADVGDRMGSRKNSHRVKSFVRHLLAATCLTAASVGAAHASTFTESTDFSDTFAGATALPDGTDVVIGQVFAPGSGDFFDFFKFSDLTPSASFDVNFTSTTSDVVGGQVFDSAESSFGTVGFGLGYPKDINGIVPSDGILVVGITAEEGGPYTVKLTSPSAVPEPATTALTGLGMLLVGGLGWRRRQKQ
jgi:hypothetical protein